MPRAGWCRECGEWVWVDDAGACQHGHAPDCVESVHEQDDPSAPSPGPMEPAASESKQAESPAAPSPDDFGIGELPRDLRRFHWGAFFLPFFWGVAYRSWPILTAWLIAVMSPVMIVAFTGATAGGRLTNLVAAAVMSEVVSGLCRLWAGLNANAVLWRREAVLRELVPGYRSKFSVDRFISRQRAWTIAGAIVALLGTAIIAPLEANVWREYGLTYVGAAMPLVWLGAEIGLGLWLDSRLRKDGPDIEQRAHDLT